MPLVLLYVLLFSIGAGLVLSALVVYFRDIQYLYGVLLTALNYLTPIFYPVGMLPEWLQKMMVLNPLYDFITMFRKVMIYGQWPASSDFLICTIFSVLAVVLGIFVFKKTERNFILYI